MTVQSIDPILVVPFENTDEYVTIRYRSKSYLWTKDQAIKVLGFFANLDNSPIKKSL